MLIKRCSFEYTFEVVFNSKITDVTIGLKVKHTSLKGMINILCYPIFTLTSDLESFNYLLLFVLTY